MGQHGTWQDAGMFTGNSTGTCVHRLVGLTHSALHDAVFAPLNTE